MQSEIEMTNEEIEHKKKAEEDAREFTQAILILIQKEIENSKTSENIKMYTGEKEKEIMTDFVKKVYALWRNYNGC